MDTEILFTATKWEILKMLEKGQFSPMELAEQLGSSLANVSQQLRLLEMAGLVVSERVSNRERGKPRVLYSLAGNLSYLIATSDSFVDKKVVQLSERNKAVLRIWFLEDPDIRYALEKAFWQIEQNLTHIAQITYAGIEEGKPVIEINSSESVPAALDVDGVFGTVLVRTDSHPTGFILYQAECAE